MPQFSSSLSPLSPTLHGLLISSILIPAAISSLFSGHLANKLGRIRAISLGTFVFGLGASIESSSVKLGMLIAGRVIKGLGEGGFLSLLVVYITEISPPRSRGTLASIPQLFVTIGIFTGYFLCYGSVSIPSSLSWRLPFVIQALIAFSFTLSTLLLLDESPRWLTARGRAEESTRVWEALGVRVEERERIEPGKECDGMSVGMKDILVVFGAKVWKRTMLGKYAPILFQSAGLSSSTSSFLASGISALLIFLVTIPAFLLCDSWGRKTSTLVGGTVQGLCMVIIGILYASDSVHSHSGPGRWVVIIMIYLFAVVFSAAWGVGFRVYVSEIQPMESRAGAASLSLSANWISNWIVAFTTPIFLARSNSGVYFLWGGASWFTVAVCALCMPETRGKSLEEIQGLFEELRVLKS
ncbi:hypothetical protein B7494_g564 [Chlorociboria aeruginascens]|nr:hypothetical protein B7494_g564 [Chlorociboria aeruginascens]